MPPSPPPVVVFNGASASGSFSLADARRYLNSQGQLVQSWTAANTATASPVSATFRIIFDKTEDLHLPCQPYEPYDPAQCHGREYMYADGEGSEGWTPACCLEDYGDHQPNPNQRDCEGDGGEEETEPPAADTSGAAFPGRMPVPHQALLATLILCQLVGTFKS